MVKLEEPDNGQAWVVAVAVCLINILSNGLSRMKALLYVAVIQTYGVSRLSASEPFAVADAIRFLGGPIIGVIGQRYGVKAAVFGGGVIGSLGIALSSIAPNVFWLTVFWGGLFGFGNGLACTLISVLINQHFHKYRAIALGIAFSGSSIGSFLLPYVLEDDLEEFGLSGGFFILSGIFMHILPISLLLKPPQWIDKPEQYARLKGLKMKQTASESLKRGSPAAPEEENRKTEDISSAGKSHAFPMTTISGDLEKKQSDSHSTSDCEKTHEVSSVKKTSILENIRGIGTLYTNPAFVLISVCMALHCIICYSVLIVIVDYGKDKRIPESYGISIMDSIFAGDLIGKLCLGWITDKKLLSISTYLAMIFILRGIFLFLLPLVTNFHTFMLLLALYGIIWGTVIAHYPLLILLYVDSNLQSLAMGCEGFLSGIVSFAIPVIVGYFRDVVGSYDGMFYLLGTMSVVAGGLWLLIPCSSEFSCKKSEHNKI